MPDFFCPNCYRRQSIDTSDSSSRILCSQCQKAGVITIMQPLVSTSPPTHPSIVLHEMGDTMNIEHSGMSYLNGNSTLRRQIFTLIDNTLPVRLAASMGPTVKYRPSSNGLDAGFQYQASYAICAMEPTVAFKLRILLFNVYNAYVRTLTDTQIADVSVENLYRCSSTWDIASPCEATEHYASLAYVASVRTADGYVQHADSKLIFSMISPVFEQLHVKGANLIPI